MDDLARGATLALLGVLTGGVLAIVAQQIADRRLDDRLKRALRAEMRLDVATARSLMDATHVEPLPRMRRRAWTAAHGLSLAPEVFAALADFYAQVDRYEEYATMTIPGEINIGGPFVARREELARIAAQVVKLYETADRALR